MKVSIIRNLSDVADMEDLKPTDPIITRDGAKIVTFNVDSVNLMSAINTAYMALLQVIKPEDADKTVYIGYGTLDISVAKYNFSLLVGIEGVLDIDKRLMEVLPKNPIEPKSESEASSPESAEPVVIDMGQGEAAVRKE